MVKSIDFNSRKNWEEMFERFADNASKFKNTFYDIIQDYEKHND